MNGNLKPTITWQLTSYLKSGSVFFGITTFLLLILWVVSHFFGFKHIQDLGGCSITGSVLFFVFGLTSRSDLRLYSRLDISRHVTFWSTIASILVTALALSLWAELMLAVVQAMEPQTQFLHLSDLFSVLYLNALPASSMSLLQHAQSLLFNFILMTLMFSAGGFLSFLFLRLKSLVSTLITVGVFLAVLIILPHLSKSLPKPIRSALDTIGTTIS